MSFRIGAALFSLVLLVFVSTIGYTEEPEKTEKVVITGIGVDIDKAKQNAIRNAVEQVIGAYVTSDTIVKNSQLLKDEILSYSGGYVKETKVISQKVEGDGLFSIQIEALVVSSKLRRKLENLNIATKKVEGESLFGEAFSKVVEQKSSGELLAKTLSKYPQASYLIEVGKPEIESTDSNSNRAKVSIPLVIKWDKVFLEELKNVLSMVSKDKIEWANIVNKDKQLTELFRKGNKVLCFSSKGILKSGKAEACWGIDDKNFSKGKSLSLLNIPVSNEKMSLSISFKDKDNNVIELTTYFMKREDRDSAEKQEIPNDYSNFSLSALRMILNGEGFMPPNILWKGLHTRELLLLTDGVFNLTIKADVDINNLSNISSIEVHVNPW